MQMVTDGSAFPGLHAWAANLWLNAKGAHKRRRTSRRVNIGCLEVRVFVACTWMWKMRKEFVAAKVLTIFPRGQGPDQHGL
jgi:hypothetical protein